ncbi:MAG: tetratricopeptide repeat protein [Myxococcota bacterium]|jgi:hypothetical protein|nr:tetratricopeptide repeat protein [Myxococcota bacterium]
MIVVIATALAWTSPALAQDQPLSDADKAQAADAFLDGQKLFSKGAYLEAAALFERAYHLAPHPAVLANIGYCYDAAGDYPRAVEVFREYLKQPNSDSPESNKEIVKYLKKTAAKVADLHVNCFGARCEVTVDKVPRGMAPTTLVLLAGPHVVYVAAVDGDQVRHYEVVLPGRGNLVLDVDLSSAESSKVPALRNADATPESESVEPSPPRLRAPFWIATSTTVAAGAAAAILGALAHQVREDFRTGGSTNVDKKQQGENLVLGTNIAIGVTAAAAATALVLGIVDLRRKPARDAGPSDTAGRPRVTVSFAGGAFIGIRGSFDWR